MSYNYNYNRAHTRRARGKGRKSKDDGTGECIKLNSEVHEDISLLDALIFSLLLCPHCVTMEFFIEQPQSGRRHLALWQWSVSSESREISTLLQTLIIALMTFILTAIVWQASSIIRYLFKCIMTIVILYCECEEFWLVFF